MLVASNHNIDIVESGVTQFAIIPLDVMTSLRVVRLVGVTMDVGRKPAVRHKLCTLFSATLVKQPKATIESCYMHDKYMCTLHRLGSVMRLNKDHMHME